MLGSQSLINCQGKIIDLAEPVVMGILNITPDSFFDGGRFTSDKAILSQTEKMLSEGAAFIDIGGMSSRPGAEILSSEEELRRVLPAIKSIKKEFPESILSIDTVYSSTVSATVDQGVALVNDISAGRYDDNLFKTIGELGIPYILMHMQGNPEDMQKKPLYDSVIEEVLDFFIEKIKQLRDFGAKDLIVDPGFGFGKTVSHNYELLKKMHVFKVLGRPVLAGVSRKSMICKVLKINPKDALNGTTALHMVALQQGARILRVHDVKEAVETIKIWKTLEDVGN